MLWLHCTCAVTHQAVSSPPHHCPLIVPWPHAARQGRGVYPSPHPDPSAILIQWSWDPGELTLHLWASRGPGGESWHRVVSTVALHGY